MIDIERLKSIQATYRRVLTQDIIPFWYNHSVDRDNGGYYNYLDRDGSILSRDKSVWLQNRSLWFFSKIYNEVQPEDMWKDSAATGYRFIAENCFDNDGRMFFLVDEKGRKLRKRRYWYTETFGVLGFCEYSKINKNIEALNLARRTYKKILALYENPDNSNTKFYIENCKMRSLVSSMLLMSTTQEIREVDEANGKKYNDVIDSCIDDIRQYFFKPEEGALLETVGSDGKIINTPHGRIVNPGHSLETAWFLMTEALFRGDKDIFNLAIEILNCSLDRGWDNEYGGIYTFTDMNDKPSAMIEWDMKFWWTHTESLYAMLLAYIATQDDTYLVKYEKIHNWTFSHFPDYEFGEWFGYLHRDGSLSSRVKGSDWKGTLHLPRLLLNGIKIIDDFTHISEIFC